MSEKGRSFVVTGEDENCDGSQVSINFNVDYISTEFVYIGVEDRSYAVPVEQMKGLTRFLYNELGLYFGPTAD